MKEWDARKLWHRNWSWKPSKSAVRAHFLKRWTARLCHYGATSVAYGATEFVPPESEKKIMYVSSYLTDPSRNAPTQELFCFQNLKKIFLGKILSFRPKHCHIGC